MKREPRVTVVIPTWGSEATAGRCLEALRNQTYRDFETVVVDSSPTDATASVVGRFPEVRLERSAARLLPHAARNRGAALSRSELLVFTDPDIYPAPDWLAALVARYDRCGQPVVGALICHGDRWLDQGIHLVKFSKWLPGAARYAVDNAPTAAVLYPRRLFDTVGGFNDSLMAGDALFSWRAQRLGSSLVLESRAVAAHHHLSHVHDFVRERLVRGVELGAVRSAWCDHGRTRALLFLVASILPVRLLRVLALVAGHCLRAGQFRTFVATLPVIVIGHGASLTGEAIGFGRRLARAGAASPDLKSGSRAVPLRGP